MIMSVHEEKTFNTIQHTFMIKSLQVGLEETYLNIIKAIYDKPTGYSPWGCNDSDTIEQLTLHFQSYSGPNVLHTILFSQKRITLIHLHII